MEWAFHRLRLCGSEGKLDEAEKMYQWALQGKEKAWGSDHTVLTLDTVNNFGFLYKSQFKLDEVYQWALQRYDSYKKALWGPDHTSTLSAVNNLPGLLGPSSDKYPPLKPEVALPRKVNIPTVLCLT
jgi:hypothetical protein